jgi:hypothetical protein
MILLAWAAIGLFTRPPPRSADIPCREAAQHVAGRDPDTVVPLPAPAVRIDPLPQHFAVAKKSELVIAECADYILAECAGYTLQ